MPMIEDFLMKKGYSVLTEAPLLTKKIDALGFKEKFRRKKLIAIEVKISQWKNALSQAIVYKLGTDLVYIAIWHEFIHRVNKKALKEFGIGLMEINGTTIVKLKPKKVNKIHQDIKEQLEQLFE